MASFWEGFNNQYSMGAVTGGGPSVMMSLGPMRFGVIDQEYQSLKTSMSWRWEEKARYLRAPALQYQGPGTITKTFDITIIAQRATDLEFIPFLQALGNEGKPLRLIAGHTMPSGGANVLSGSSDMGLWCITQLDVDESEFLRDGIALLYKGSLTIKSYGEDRV